MSQSQINSFESDEEDILFMPMEASPVPWKKLKRLKKAREVPRNDVYRSTDVGDSMDYVKVNDLENSNHMSNNTSLRLHDEEQEWIGLGSSCNSVDEEEREKDKEENPIADSYKETKSLEATNDSAPEVCSGNEELQVPVEDDEHVMETTQDLHKVALSTLEKKKKRRMESTGKSKPASRSLDAVENRPHKKKRSEFDKIHAESQRLLRETRDVSFKSLPTINKPISSVLEKIRLRKLQLEQKAGKGSARLSKESKDDDASSEDLLKDNSDMESSDDDEKKDGALQENPETENKEDFEEANIRAPLVNDSGIPKTPDTCAQTNLLEKDIVDDIPITSDGFRAPNDDTQDLFCNSQLSSGEDLDQNPGDSSQDGEEVAPELLSMNLKVDSHPDEEELFDEDENKENVDPSPTKPTEAITYNRVAPVKAFVDDEAEDEDEDVLLGHGEDDASDDDECEDLEDIVATAEEEQPMDQSRRDELHRKWLEQQDAAATSDILLRLGCGKKQRGRQTRKTTLLDEDDAIPFDNHGDDMIESDDKVGHHSSDSEESKHGDDDFDMELEAPLKTTLDGDDAAAAFVSSDDEEVEERLMRERVLQDSEEQEMFLTPADDDTSREIFGLIKKVNIAPNGKKKPKTSQVFREILGSGVNSNSSSKSSFLGKTSSSLQTSHKQGLGSSKSYIFGRDDSNSRHAISKTEGQEDTDQKENENNLSSTQRKFKSNESGKNAAKCVNDSGKGPSLFEILRRQTSEMDRTLQNRNTNESIENKPVNTMSHFAAFKSFTSIKTLKRTG